MSEPESECFYVVIRLKGNPYGKGAIESGVGMIASLSGAQVDAEIHDNLDEFIAAHVLEILAEATDAEH